MKFAFWRIVCRLLRSLFCDDVKKWRNRKVPTHRFGHFYGPPSAMRSVKTNAASRVRPRSLNRKDQLLTWRQPDNDMLDTAKLGMISRMQSHPVCQSKILGRTLVRFESQHCLEDRWCQFCHYCLLHQLVQSQDQWFPWLDLAALEEELKSIWTKSAVTLIGIFATFFEGGAQPIENTMKINKCQFHNKNSFIFLVKSKVFKKLSKNRWIWAIFLV